MIEGLGTVAVTAMMLCYALEERGVGFTFGFAAGCIGAASYAALIGSWPFFVVESLWAGVAARRGLRRLEGAQAGARKG
ncbi:MAG: hypothetical protein QNK05_03035 [Myxococcota bacterium]|nr:hypothetical protein [Myxococcota bacterium]